MRYLSSLSSGLFLAITLFGCSDGGTGSTGTTGAGGGSSTSTSTSTGTGTGGSSTSTGTSTGAGTSTGTGGAPSDVTGTIIDTYITETGDVPVPNTTGTPIALVPAGNSFTMIPGTVAADGTFKIPGVPAGTYYLALQSNGQLGAFIVTDQRQLDLGGYYAGRPDVKPITMPTNLVLNLTGLNAWQDTDSLEIFSHGAASGSDLLASATSFPSVGDVALSGITADASTFFAANEIESAKGDTTVFTQLTSRTPGAFAYNAIGKSFKPAAFSLLDGKTTPVTGAFTDTAQQSVMLDWKRSLYAGFTAVVNPGATLTSSEIYVYGEPGGATRVTRSYSPTVLFGTDAATDDVALKLDYGFPFPASWAAVGYVSGLYSVPYLVPGTATMKHVTVTIDVAGPLADIAAGAVKPIIGPPTALQINGKDAFAVNAGVGLTPTLSWSAPALGTPALYQVYVRKIDPNLGSGHGVGTFTTQGTSITFPSGVLESGSSYFVRVTAESAGSITAPYKPSPTAAFATVVSGVFSP